MFYFWPATDSMEDARYSLNHLIQVSGNDTEFIVEILDMFVPKAAEEIDRTKKLIAAREWKEAEFVVHRLRSSAGSVGAKKIAWGCSEFERYLSSSDDIEKSVHLYLDQFLESSRAELSEIEKELDKLKGRSHE